MDFTVLIVDDEEEMCRSLSILFSKYNLHSIYTTNPLKVPDLIQANSIDLIIMDIKMPQQDGLGLLRSIKEFNSAIPIIMITGHPSVFNAVSAMKYGAIDFLTKPLDNVKLIEDIQQLASLMDDISNQDLPVEIIMKSREMQKLVDDVKTVACTEANVLLTGESGTGKEVIADLIHSLSPRKDEQLLKINCASIPETLLESQLFGYAAGAFTDAKKPLTGKFELATKGTLFLDEIGDMSVATQPKLLRVLQDGEIQPLGSEKIIKVNPRIIAATNRDLKAMIDEGEFREDLFFRLSVISLHLPTLRERKEDILELTARFIDQFSEVHNKPVTGISDEVKSILLTHSWPGNIRELKNCIERAVIFAKGTKIQVENLPSQYNQFENSITGNVLDHIVNMLTREQIIKALESTGGVKYKAAELLNISRKTLYSRMKNLGME